MADELTRRREIRRRKILEGSEARLKKITSFNNKKCLDKDTFCYGDSENTTNQRYEVDEPSSSISYGSNIAKLEEEDDFPSSENSNTMYDTQRKVDTLNSCGNRLTESNSPSAFSDNGSCPRSSSPDYYEFPKKVSDAETRSFGRTRSDMRRNSSCTQIMMETLQFSSFYFDLLRFWLTAVTAFGLKIYFLISNNLPVFETIFIPFMMLEIGFCSWSKFDPQVSSRPVISSLISGVMLLCGFPSAVISGFNSVLNVIQTFTVDFCFYVFSFVFFHFILETYV